jgi:hypothetical protein
LDFGLRILTPPRANQNIAVFNRLYNSRYAALMFFLGHAFSPKKTSAKLYAGVLFLQ